MPTSTPRVAGAIAAAVIAFGAAANDRPTILRADADGMAIEILRGDEVVLQLRPAAEIAPAAERNADPRVINPFADGASAGTLVVAMPLFDARGSAIDPAEYALQYRIQPPLKEHVDTAEYRDFLLLRRGDAKTAEHPLVLAMVPATGEVGSAPRLRDDGPLIIEFDLGHHRVALAFSY